MSQTNILTPPLPSGKNSIVSWNNLCGSSIGLALTEAFEAADAPLLVITENSLQASHLADAIQFFSGTNQHTYLFLDWETLPYDQFSPHQDITSDRLALLYRLPLIKKGIIITTVATIMHPVPPKEYLERYSFILRIGDRLNISELRTRLTHGGYQAVSQVREHGEFAIRGSIIDLFPMGTEEPFRIDLFDDEVESIRMFSTDTQRSHEKVNQIELLPAHEFSLTDEAIDLFREKWRQYFDTNPLKTTLYTNVCDGIAPPGIEYYLPLFFHKTETLFDYLPEETIIINHGKIEAAGQDFWQAISHRYEQFRYDITRPLIPPHQLFIPIDQISGRVNQHPQIKINGKIHIHDFETQSLTALEMTQHHQESHTLLKNFITQQKGRILMTAETMGRREIILQLLASLHFHPTYFESWDGFIKSDKTFGITVANLDEGFLIKTPALTVLPETMLYGNRIMQRRRRTRSTQEPETFFQNLAELQLNDAVVHIDHGIGRYRGLQTLTIGDQLGEYLTIEYDNSDKLYVPVSSLHLISRYSGIDPEHAPLNKLGTDSWQKAKKRAAEKIRDVAAELLDLYAHREAKPGHAFTIDQEQFELFNSGFPFEETADQLQAIAQVAKDMSASKPMDRVICGDVGFGKTEVAMRAAFLAAQNNMQVAVLVPTTLLAQQHYENFRNRFADWPIVVEVLSRFNTAKETKQILEKLSDGKIDIVIGTHKLLQDTVHFKSLGLVIIDEEHRFGVKHKERLKSLRSSIDFLTLTATPIPRTLNMALSGIRDLSIIATPPLKRLSVKTFVSEYNDQIIQEAIRREILRGGQVYFLHNEVNTIQQKANEIATLIPEAKPIIAHGQMHERDLERIMSAYYHREYNVLVCSTIIESGIDIPSANTILINRADKFGLAQLHQLRGRVGRSHHQAYAYLLTPPSNMLTADAVKRLDVIHSFDHLGMGFTLASHDLEIRGAGELLGEGQSGNMHEIGYTLYMDLLSRAVDDLKQGKTPSMDYNLMQNRTEIDLHIPALIPEDYLNDVQLRLQFYKKIAHAKDESELDQVQIEMIDRFGLLPQPIKNLIGIAQLKQLADSLGINKVDASASSGKIELSDKPKLNPETIIRLIQIKTAMYRLDGPTRIRFNLPQHTDQERIACVKRILVELSS